MGNFTENVSSINTESSKELGKTQTDRLISFCLRGRINLLVEKQSEIWRKRQTDTIKNNRTARQVDPLVEVLSEGISLA